MTHFRPTASFILLFFAIILIGAVAGISQLLMQMTVKAETIDTGPRVEIKDWTPTSSLKEGLAVRNAVQVGEYVYVVGGRNNAGKPINTVRRAKINLDGALEEWKETLALPVKRYLHAMVATETHLYVIGGWNGDDVSNSVWRGKINDGEVEEWNELKSSPYKLKIDLHDAVIVNNRIYVVGGFDGAINGTQKNVSAVYYATISDDGLGNLSEWSPATSLQKALRRHSIANSGNIIYVTGGYTDNDIGVEDVYYTTVNPDDGSLGEWIPGPSLLEARYYHDAVVHDNRLVVLGGQTNSLQATSSVVAAQIGNDGSLSSWKGDGEAALPAPLYRFSAVSINRYGSDFLIALGGISDTGLQRAVYYSTLPDAPTPTPTPIPTATPTPRPGLTLNLENTSQQWLAPGDDVEYILRYSTSTSPLGDVQIIAEVPTDTELVPDTVKSSTNAPFTFSGVNAQSDIIWQIGDLEPNVQGNVSYRVVRPLALDGEEKILAVHASGPSTVSSDEPISYTLTLSNNSLSLPLPNVVVSSTLPAGATFLRSIENPLVETAEHDGAQITWRIPQLDPGTSLSIQFSVTAESSIVFSNARASAPGNVRAKNERVIITKVAGTAIPPEGDGRVIINPGVTSAWQYDTGSGRAESNTVMNPMYESLLPLIMR